MAEMPSTMRIMPKDARHPREKPVVVLAYDGLCTFEFGCAVEVFGLPRPEMGADWYRFAVAAIEPGPLRATGGVRVLANGGLDLLAGAGTIIVPGWRDIDEDPPDNVIQALREAHAAGARILSLCSGVFVLAAAGLLDGRRATTHWRYAARLAVRYPALSVAPDVLYVDEGQVLTAAGSAAGIDLCLHLVRRDWGARTANRIARRLVLPAHRQGGQAQFVERPVPVDRGTGSRLGPLLDTVRTRLDEAWPVERMAAEAAVSVRSLFRVFADAIGKSPSAWVTAERVTHARDLLERSPASLETIAGQCGFPSAAVLRQHFRDALGTTPALYRSQFGRTEPAGRRATS